MEASLDSNDYDNDSVPTSWVRQGIMPLPGITCKANKLPPCPKEDSFDLRSGQIHAKIQVIRCHENGKIMTLMVGDILSKAISNFVAEMKISIPVEVIVDTSGNLVVNPSTVVNICVVDCVSDTLLVVSISIKSVVSNSVLFELDIITSNSEMVSI